MLWPSLAKLPNIFLPGHTIPMTNAHVSPSPHLTSALSHLHSHTVGFYQKTYPTNQHKPPPPPPRLFDFIPPKPFPTLGSICLYILSAPNISVHINHRVNTCSDLITNIQAIWKMKYFLYQLYKFSRNVCQWELRPWNQDTDFKGAIIKFIKYFKEVWKEAKENSMNLMRKNVWVTDK